jgi:hypothetical protein
MVRLASRRWPGDGGAQRGRGGGANLALAVRLRNALVLEPPLALPRAPVSRRRALRPAAPPRPGVSRDLAGIREQLVAVRPRPEPARPGGRRRRAAVDALQSRLGGRRRDLVALAADDRDRYGLRSRHPRGRGRAYVEGVDRSAAHAAAESASIKRSPPIRLAHRRGRASSWAGRPGASGRRAGASSAPPRPARAAYIEALGLAVAGGRPRGAHRKHVASSRGTPWLAAWSTG